jgi:mono/diheme cytochrome c family protein
MTRRLGAAAALALGLAFRLSFALAQNPELPAKPSASPNKVDYTPLAKVPKKALQRNNPLENDPEAVAAGANLFDQHCAECHGDMAQGGRKGPSLLPEPVQQATPGALFFILTNGVVRRGMPVWSKLPEPQRWQLVAYIRSLTAHPKPESEQRKTESLPTDRLKQP